MSVSDGATAHRFAELEAEIAGVICGPISLIVVDGGGRRSCYEVTLGDHPFRYRRVSRTGSPAALTDIAAGADQP